MIHKKLSHLQNIAAKELASLAKYLSSEREMNNPNIETVFSNKSKKQIVEMILLGADSSGGNWGDKARQLVVLLTDVLVFYRNRGEVVLSPSLYLQYLDLKNLQTLVDFEPSNQEYEALLKPLREFLYAITRSSKSEEYTNEQIGFITMQLISNLSYLESIKVPKSLANRLSIQKARHMRIAHADYSYTHISQERLIDLKDNGIALIYKNIKQSSFLGAVGSIDAQHTTFEDCDFSKAKFHHSAFVWTTFINTSIKQTTFNQCRFFDVDFDGMTDSDSAVFIRCQICLCNILDSKALFIDCDFQDCEQADDLRIINNKE